MEFFFIVMVVFTVIIPGANKGKIEPVSSSQKGVVQVNEKTPNPSPAALP